MQLKAVTIILALSLCLAAEVGAQATLDSIQKSVDEIKAALKISVPIPPPPPPPPGDCPIKTSGGKFSVGDKAKISSPSGWQMRSSPSLDVVADMPSMTGGQEAVVTCVRQVGVDQWVQLGLATGWARDGCCDGGTVVPSPLLTLTANPLTVADGQSSLLTWTTTNATSCAASGGWTGVKAVSGTESVVPTALNTVYTMVCTGTGGNVTRSVTVVRTGKPLPDIANYYVSPTGMDANPGTLALPFLTIQRCASLLKPGEVCSVFGGEYDATANSFTTNGSTSVIPSGESWEKPVTIRAYPGERPVLRRFLPAGSNVTEDQMRSGIHLATPAECKARASVPYPCWSGGGVAPGWLSWMDVATHGYLDGAVFRIYGPSKFIVWDGIDIDARGIVAATLQLSCNVICGSENNTVGYDGPMHMRFTNMAIRNSIASCVSNPGSPSEAQADLQFINVLFEFCGVPADKNFYNDDPAQGLARLHPNARFYHPAYSHVGMTTVINSEIRFTAGTGLSLDGDNNVIANNYIHHNASHGLLVTGGRNWRIENNILECNGGIEVYANSGQPGHYIANNTIVKCSTKNTAYSWGVYLGRGAYGMTFEKNIIDGFDTQVRSESTYGNFGYTPNNIFSNNIIRSAKPGNEFVTGAGTCPECPVAPTQSENLLNVDPMLGANYMPLPGSPALVGGAGARR